MLSKEDKEYLNEKFVTKEYLDKKLSAFVTKEYLDKKLQNFATKQDFNKLHKDIKILIKYIDTLELDHNTRIKRLESFHATT